MPMRLSYPRLPDLVRRLVRVAYAPAFAIMFLSAAVLVISRGLGPSWLLPLLLAAIFTSYVAERLAPYEPAWNRDHGDTRRDIVHAVVNEASNMVSVLMIPLLAAVAPSTGLWPGDWPLALQLLLAVIVADIGITLAHYASHKMGWLWRLHAVHHSVERLYGFNGLMKHPLHQALETLAGTSPLLVLGLPQDVAWLLAFAVAIQLLLQHSNVDMAVGPLRHLWAVAPVHRFHHRRSATEGDVNFGLFTTLGDHLLGTARFEPHRPVRAGDVGIADRTDYPRGYLRQLIEPFRC